MMIIKVFAACVVLVSGFLGAACLPCTTQWFDRDDPSGKGDYELLSNLKQEYPGLICPNPTGIEVQTVSGQPASQTGNIFQVNDATNGFACVNADQKRRPCVDYKVRFTCPETFCSQYKRRYFEESLDNSSGFHLLLLYGHKTNASATTQHSSKYLPLCSVKERSHTECTTQWFDRDDPSGKGDYELLSNLKQEYPGLICPNPTGIEVQTVTGQPASQTGNIFQVNDATNGFACVNADQRGKQCVDYKVRFTCPETFCSRCRTSWIDRDDPSGKGDYETLETILAAYPGKVCSQPIAIEVKTISGIPALKTGNILYVNDPLQGFACVNEQQQGMYCEDYMVRFTCPQKFCK